jgi:hypothetical protein
MYSLPIHLLKISWLHPSFGNYQLSCYKPPCAFFYADVSFELIWVNVKECDCQIIYMVRVCLAL